MFQPIDQIQGQSVQPRASLVGQLVTDIRENDYDRVIQNQDTNIQKQHILQLFKELVSIINQDFTAVAEHQQNHFSNIPRNIRQKNIKVSVQQGQQVQQSMLTKKSKNSKSIKKMKDYQSQVQFDLNYKTPDYSYRSEIFSQKLKFEILSNYQITMSYQFINKPLTIDQQIKNQEKYLVQNQQQIPNKEQMQAEKQQIRNQLNKKEPEKQYNIVQKESNDMVN